MKNFNYIFKIELILKDKYEQILEHSLTELFESFPIMVYYEKKMIFYDANLNLIFWVNIGEKLVRVFLFGLEPKTEHRKPKIIPTKLVWNLHIEIFANSIHFRPANQHWKETCKIAQ